MGCNCTVELLLSVEGRVGLGSVNSARCISFFKLPLQMSHCGLPKNEKKKEGRSAAVQETVRLFEGI